MQNIEIVVAYKREKKLKELLAMTNPHTTINIFYDEMHTHSSCNKRCDSCTDFVVTKSRFECFTTKRI